MAIIVSNNAVSRLTTAINATATTLNITGGTGAKFPSTAAGDQFYVVLIDSSNNIEIVLCTARSGDILTVTRGQESTTARAFSVGDRVLHTITAATFNSRADKTVVDASIAALQSAIDALTASKANLDSPALTGNPTAPTQAPADNSTRLATTAYVQAKTAALGTMSTQDANAVAITGGTINSQSVTLMGSNTRGNRTISTTTPTGGADGDIWYQY